jgi:hypothetical protein
MANKKKAKPKRKRIPRNQLEAMFKKAYPLRDFDKFIRKGLG